MLLRRALRRAGNVRRCRQKSSSPKEDPFHNRATAMNFEEGEGWLQRLVAPRAGRRPRSSATRPRQKLR